MDMNRNLKWQLFNTTNRASFTLHDWKNVSHFYRGLGCFSSRVEWFVSYLVRNPEVGLLKTGSEYTYNQSNV